MFPSDVTHPDAPLQDKLKRLYDLRVDKNLTLGFRPEYLELLKALGNPQRKLPPTIHIAGTNGKGSTVATLRALLEAEGKTVHTYTSPHLKRFNERIVLAGQEITDAYLETLIDRALELNAEREATFFEITTAIAFTAFAETPADILILETGLGGRLDCTNIIEKPIVTIITALGLDHQDILGPRLEDIAFEKSGIMKPDTPCILAAQNDAANRPEVMDIFYTRSKELNAPLWVHGADWSIRPKDEAQMVFHINQDEFIFPRPNLVGMHQIHNAGNALAGLYVTSTQSEWPTDKYRNGLSRIVWKGRFEQIDCRKIAPHLPVHSELWFDGGHNAEGAAVIARQLAHWADTDAKPLHLIFGMKGDKNARAFLDQVLLYAQSITHIDIHGVGSFLDQETFANIMNANFPEMPYSHQNTVQESLSAMTSDNPVRILLCGSLYLAKQLP